MMKFLLFCVVGLLLSVGKAPALTVIPRTFDELISRADVVFEGSVTALTSKWVGEGETRHIVTFVTFQVEDTYKGEAVAVRTLRFLGGQVGETTMDVPEIPRFEVGQISVLFVKGNGEVFCPLVGVSQGRFHVSRDGAGTERITADDGSPVVNTSEIGKFDTDGTPIMRKYARVGAQGMTTADFASEILAKVAAARPAHPY